VFPHLGA